MTATFLEGRLEIIRHCVARRKLLAEGVRPMQKPEPKPSARFISPEKRTLIATEIQKGEASRVAIAERFGVSRASVQSIAKEIGDHGLQSWPRKNGWMREELLQMVRDAIKASPYGFIVAKEPDEEEEKL
jgi:hypothetical protein